MDLKSTIEMVMGEAERGGVADRWGGTFQKSTICDADVLRVEKDAFLATGEGRL